MSIAERTTEQLLTIGEVCHALEAAGIARSASWVRRHEDLGLITPFRTRSVGLRVYTLADVEALKGAIRVQEGSRDAA